MLLVCLLAATALAETPEQIHFTAGNQEISYLHSAGGPDSAVLPDWAVLIVLPTTPETAAGEFKGWNEVVGMRKWHLIIPQTPTAGDPGIKVLEALVTDARQRFSLDKSPIYLAGAGPMSATVFYAVSRVPHLFASALAINGSPKPAVDTDRLFAANTNLVPVAWAATPEDKAANSSSYQKLITGGFNLTLLESPTTKQAADFLARSAYDPQPVKIDCETGNPVFARCYWITPTEFDGTLRNDALKTTRIAPDSQASLDFGGFGYQVTKPGPGVVVEYLAPDYKGPLKLNDRIVALSGTPIADPRHYVELLSQVNDEKPVAVTIERLGEKHKMERVRLVTRYQLKKREEVLTARIQAEYAAGTHEIDIVSRTVASLKILVPPAWTPATINWNGTVVGSPQNPGCWLVSIKNPGSAHPCTF